MAGGDAGVAAGVALGRATGGGFGDAGTGGSIMILLGADAELVGDVRGTSFDWLLDCGGLLREISAAMNELTSMTRITPAVTSADGLARWRCRPARTGDGFIPQRLPA